MEDIKFVLWPFLYVFFIYFTHFEQSQSVGGAKTGDPREKTPDHPQAELGLSHMWPELASNPQRWDDERFRALKISGLKHSATWAANIDLSLQFNLEKYTVVSIWIWIISVKNILQPQLHIFEFRKWAIKFCEVFGWTEQIAFVLGILSHALKRLILFKKINTLMSIQ